MNIRSWACSLFSLCPPPPFSQSQLPSHLEGGKMNIRSWDMWRFLSAPPPPLPPSMMHTMCLR